jgi:hypothetical protein
MNLERVISGVVAVILVPTLAWATVPVPVPEPSSMLLFGAGAGALVALRRLLRSR